MKSKNIIFVLILSFAFLARIVGVNWDDDHHLHPDERFLTMVTGSMQWSKSLPEYLNTATSKMNPHNLGYGFYVYGTYPLIVVKAISDLLGKSDYNGLTIVGRALSAIIDTSIVVLVFLIAKKISKSTTAGLLAMFLYAVTALSIQLSHFFTTDPYLTVFSLIALYLVISDILGIPLGLIVGLAFAAKISAVLLGPTIIIAYVVRLYRLGWRQIPKVLISALLFLLTFGITVRVTYPYLFTQPGLFTLNQKILTNFKQLKSFEDPSSYFPPGVQWITTKPIIHPLIQSLYFGFGVPISICIIGAVGYVIFKKRDYPMMTLLFYSCVIFVYQGIQFAKALRYLYPAYPELIIITGIFLASLMKKIPRYVSVGLLVLLSAWGVMVTHIYTQPHTRITASNWIFTHIPAKSVVAGESWDDTLPMTVANNYAENYIRIELPITGPDTPAKWQNFNTMLLTTDYIVLTSNRGYGSMMTVPELFPQTTAYYQQLFDGTIGFTKVAEFTSRPNLPLPFIHTCIHLPFVTYGIGSQKSEVCNQSGISVIDDYAEELWTVYDHPKVIIFKNNRIQR